MSDTSPEILTPRLSAAVAEFAEWWNSQLTLQGETDKVQSPLYHYTDARGLAGIINNQEVWLTSVFHLNDPSELLYGMEIAREALYNRAQTADDLARNFCEKAGSALKVETLCDIFDFFVAGFSRAADDLGQWRAYADNGRGFAIGLAPHLFHPEDKKGLKANEKVFVANVAYGRTDVKASLENVIDRAISIICRERSNIDSPAQLKQFLIELSILLGSSILWHGQTTKHEAYRHEEETRLMIVGDKRKLADHVELRTRGSALVPFIRSPMPVQASGSMTEIVIGPSAHPSAEDAVRALLVSHGLTKVPVRRSEIPYRAH